MYLYTVNVLYIWIKLLTAVKMTIDVQHKTLSENQVVHLSTPPICL